MNKNIVISIKTIVLTILMVVLFALLYQIRDVVFQILIAMIAALAIEPAVGFMMKKKFPRWLAVGLVFICFVFIVSLFTTLALPVVITQTKLLLSSLPALLSSVVTSPDVRDSLNSSLSDLALASGGLFTFTVNLFSNALSFLTLFIFTLYLSLDLPNVKKRFLALFPEKYVKYVNEAWMEIEVNLNRWIKGQILLMVAVGLTAYVGLLVLKVPYAVPLALLSGLLEVVPVLGPIIATVIAGVVGFSISPLMGILVVALFVGIQQLENTLLVPRVMQKVIGFNPLVTMLAILVGGKLMGVVGALVSIPVVLIFLVIIHSLVVMDMDGEGVE